MSILLVEDDPMLGCAVVDGLRVSFAVDWAKTIADAELALAANTYQLMILDLVLPDGAGLGLLRKLRREKNPIPVMILTARDALDDRLAGLNSGADDYMVKPFDLAELIARCDVVLRRLQGRTEASIGNDDLVYFPASQSATLAGRPLDLSAREIAILDILMRNLGRVVSKSRIEDRLYSGSDMVESNTVEVHMSHLRRKIGKDRIRTLRNLGYIMPKAT